LIRYLILQLVLLLVFYSPWLFGGRSFFFEDVTHFFQPLCTFIGESLRSGHFPLWNPYSYCGMSQLAITSPSIFYPTTWLYALMDFNHGLALNMVLHQLIAGIGGFLLIRSAGWGWMPAAVCGAAMSMSGYMFGLSSNYTLVATASWVPLTLWCLLKLATQLPARMQFWITSGLAACATMLILAGRPEVSFPALLGLACFTLVDYVRNREDDAAGQIFFSRLRGFLIGGLLTMPMVLPTLEWIPLSRRSEGLLSQEVWLFSANWYDLLTIVFGQPFGDLLAPHAPLRPIVMQGKLIPYSPSAFIGPVVFTLAIVGLLDKTWKERWVVLGLAIAGLILAMGNNTFIAPAIMQVMPALSFVRFPVKFLIFPIFCLAIAAARGLFNMEASPDSKRPWIVFGMWVLFGGVAALTLTAAGPSILAQLSSAPIEPALLDSASKSLSAHIVVGSIVGALASLAIALSKKSSKPVSILLLASSFATLLAFSLMHYTKTAAADFFTTPSFAQDALRRVEDISGRIRVLGIYLERFTVPTDFLKAGDETIQTYQYSRQLLKPGAHASVHVPSAYGFEGSMNGEYAYFLLNAYLKSNQVLREMGRPLDEPEGGRSDATLATLCKVMATPYAMTQMYRRTATGESPVDLLDKKYFAFIQEDRTMNFRLFDVKDCLPRAYFMGSWKSASRNDIINAMFDPEKSGFDPRSRVWVESDQSGEHVSSVEAERVPVPTSSFDPTNPEEILIKHTNKAEGFIVLADQFYPGWEATVDNQPADIVVANGFTRAVFVGPGSHQIRFQYQPRSLVFGQVLFAAGPLLWGLYAFRSFRRTKPEEVS
jgi:ABC-type thiamin/hydroxymethylpyrimidine transport system permease subunit